MKRQKGYSLVEVLLLLIVVGIIGFVGLYVIKARNNANKTYDQVSSSSQANTTYQKDLSGQSGVSGINSDGSKGSATLSGVVTLGPTSPVCASTLRASAATPPTPNCDALNPLQNHTMQVLNSSGKVVVTSKTNSSGAYTIYLDPGHYSIKFVPEVGIVDKSNEVDVSSGKNTFNIYLDTGIR